MKKVFPIVPAGRGPLITCGVAALVLVIIMMLAGRGPGVAAWIVDLVLGGILVLLASLAYASRHVRFEISPAGLAIRGDIYGRRLAFPVPVDRGGQGAGPARRPGPPAGAAYQRRGSAGVWQRLVQVGQRRAGPAFRDGPAGGLPPHPGGLRGASERSGAGGLPSGSAPGGGIIKKEGSDNLGGKSPLPQCETLPPICPGTTAPPWFAHQ